MTRPVFVEPDQLDDPVLLLGGAPYEVRLYAAASSLCNRGTSTDFFGINEVQVDVADNLASLIAGLPIIMLL